MLLMEHVAKVACREFPVCVSLRLVTFDYVYDQKFSRKTFQEVDFSFVRYIFCVSCFLRNLPATLVYRHCGQECLAL